MKTKVWIRVLRGEKKQGAFSPMSEMKYAMTPVALEINVPKLDSNESPDGKVVVMFDSLDNWPKEITITIIEPVKRIPKKKG